MDETRVPSAADRVGAGEYGLNSLAARLASFLDAIGAGRAERRGPGLAGVGIALSGGGDSMALAAAARRLDPLCALAVVDHGLRAESAAEAAAAAARFSPPASILPLSEPPPAGGIEAWARRARFAALAEWARVSGIETVLTAHQAEDVVETLAMRLARRPGLAGLAGLRPLAPFPVWPEGRDLWLGRPFLGVRRAALRAALTEAGLVWAEDSMNADPRFERVALRQAWARRAEAERASHFDRLWAMAVRLEARRARHMDAAAMLARSVRWSAETGAAQLAAAGFVSASAPSQALLAQALVAAVCGSETLPNARLAQTALAASAAAARSISGALVWRRRGEIVIVRAPARAVAREGGNERMLSLGPDHEGVWDGRFLVRAGPDGVVLRARGGRSLLGASASEIEAGQARIELLGPHRTAALLAAGPVRIGG